MLPCKLRGDMPTAAGDTQLLQSAFIRWQCAAGPHEAAATAVAAISLRDVRARPGAAGAGWRAIARDHGRPAYGSRRPTACGSHGVEAAQQVTVLIVTCVTSVILYHVPALSFAYFDGA